MSSYEQQMTEHFGNATKYYNESHTPNYSSYDKASCQEKGNEEYKKANECAEKAKGEIKTDTCNRARECYDKQAEAMEKGDMKAAKAYQEQGDKIMAEGEKKVKDIEEKQYQGMSEAHAAKDNGQHRTI